MNASDWIICERTGQWAAAMRVGAARRPSLKGPAQYIHEVRSLDELTEQLAARPLSLALIEAHASNLGKLLEWLAHNSRRFPRACFIAVVDRTLTAEKNSHNDGSSGEMHDVLAALLEGGAAAIALSPRRLRHIFALADLHAISARSLSSELAETLSITDWARSQLPWQLDQV
jgi:hypothetical protein